MKKQIIFLELYKQLGLKPIEEKIKKFGKVLGIASNSIFLDIAFENGFYTEKEANIFKIQIKALDNYEEMFFEKYSSEVINELIIRSSENEEGFINNFIKDIERYKSKKLREKKQFEEFDFIHTLIEDFNFIAAQKKLKISNLPYIDKEILKDLYQYKINLAANCEFTKDIKKCEFFHWLSYNQHFGDYDE